MLLSLALKKQYTLFKRKKKIREQLEIGKIKFEVTPIYANNKCIASIPSVKYNSLDTNKTEVTGTYRSNFIKILFIVSILLLLTIIIINILESLGLYTSSNNKVIELITPCIFPNITSELTPHLSLLLSKSNFLTL